MESFLWVSETQGLRPSSATSHVYYEEAGSETEEQGHESMLRYEIQAFQCVL